MKPLFKYIKHIILFLIPFLMLMTAKTAWLLYDNRYQDGDYIYEAIKKSKEETKHKKLILGDSTAGQLSSEELSEKNDIVSLACNQALGIVGQYFLLHNFLEAGNRPDTVFLVFTPSTFAVNLDQSWTYHCFLKPFYNDEYKPLMTKTVLNQIEKIPYYKISQFPYIKTTRWAMSPTDKKRDFTFISPISLEYLEKIDSVSHDYGFEVIFVSTFVTEEKRNSIELYDRTEYMGNPYEKQLEVYLDGIEYLDDDMFSDGTHLKCPKDYFDAFYKKLK